jgi:hypothetical protein
MAAWIPALPVVVAVLSRSRMTPARWWVAGWCLVLVALNAIAYTMAVRGINNHWLGYFFQPLHVAVALWALSHWHVEATARAALRFAIPLVFTVGILLSVAIEDRQTFSLISGPFHNIVLLLAALWIFVRRSVASDAPVLQQDWFWIAGGMMLIAASSTAVGPLAWYFLRPRVDLLHAMLNVRATADVAAFLAITWGMMCPKRQSFSGGYSSPRFSPSSSSLEGSP